MTIFACLKYSSIKFIIKGEERLEKHIKVLTAGLKADYDHGLFQQNFAKCHCFSDFTEDRFRTMYQDCSSFWDQNWGKAIIECCCKRQVSGSLCSYH